MPRWGPFANPNLEGQAERLAHAVDVVQRRRRHVNLAEDRPVRLNFKVEYPQEGKRGEELFNLILSGIREIYDVNAVIAGGAVRDLVAGAPSSSKDVDVFIPLDPNKFFNQDGELGWQGPSQIVKIGTYKKNEGGCVFPTLGRGSSVVQNMAVDLVFTKKPLSPDEVKLFPVHAQRCVYTLEGGKMVSPEAQKDLDNHTFTIDPTITDKERISKIVTKIEGWKKRPEYKDWKIIKPEVKEWWEDDEVPFA